MTLLTYGVAGWLLLAGVAGIVRSRDLVHAVVCLSVAQSGSYVLLVAVGYQHGGGPPLLGSAPPPAVDPVVQALTLTDVVVAAAVTALLLALSLQVARRHGTTDPDALSSLKG